ncbi:MAG: lysylphosphatidylglycerol synthase transmembrane domain-containing protein [Acidimicrobiales bacterium]
MARIVVLVLAGIAIYLVLPSLAAVIGAWPRLAKASPVWLVAAVAAEVTSFTLNFALQRVVLRTKRWFPVVTSGLAGNALTNVLPGGDAAGASLQFRMLATAGIDADRAAGGLAAASLLGIGGLLALPLFTLPVVLGGTSVRPGLLHATLIGLAGFALFTVFGIVVLATDRPLARLGRMTQWLWNTLRRPRRKLSGLDLRLIDQRDQIRKTLGSQWREAVLFIAGRLGFDYLCLVCVLRAVGSHANPALVLLAYATAGVIALIPITPGGLGIVEAGLSGMLVLAGVGVADALIATLAYRLAQYWLTLPAGSVAYVLFRRHYGPVQMTSPKEASAGPDE